MILRLWLLAAVTIACVTFAWILASAADSYRSTDLFCLWQGARLTASGDDPYDEARWRSSIADLSRDLGPGTGAACPGRYAYPLWTAVLMLPFGILPLSFAAVAWMAISFGAVALGIALIRRAIGGGRELAILFPTIVLASQPFWSLVITGQPTGILLGLIGLGAWLLSRGRDGLASATFTALLIKPQVAGLFLPVLVLQRTLAGRPTAILGATAVTAALLAISLATRPSWMGQWLEEVTGRRLSVLPLRATAWGLSSDVLGTPLLGPVLVALLALAVAAGLRRRPYSPVTFASALLPVSIFAAPYAFSYDFLVLALPWAAALRLAGSMTRARRLTTLALTAIAASLLPWSLYAISFGRGQDTLSAAVPAAAALLVGFAVAMQPGRNAAAA